MSYFGYKIKDQMCDCVCVSVHACVCVKCLGNNKRFSNKSAKQYGAEFSERMLHGN